MAGHFDSIASRRLSSVERGIGLPKRVLQAMRAMEGGRDSNGDRATQHTARTRHLDRLIFNAGTQALGHVVHPVVICFQEDRHKLFSAYPARQVATTNGCAKQIRNLADDFISGLVAIGVIDSLEMVDIQQQQTRRRGVARIEILL